MERDLGGGGGSSQSDDGAESCKDELELIK